MLKLFAKVEIICDGHQQFSEDDFLLRELKAEKFDIVSIRSRTRQEVTLSSIIFTVVLKVLNTEKEFQASLLADGMILYKRDSTDST